jgi:hypothetical protein
MDQEEKKSAYTAMMKAWAEEADGVQAAFRSLFAGTTEGYMKFLFTLHYMTVQESLRRGIPPDQFNEILPSIVGAWYKAGKPEGVELMCITGSSLEELMERIRNKDAGWDAKPSSDA